MSEKERCHFPACDLTMLRCSRECFHTSISPYRCGADLDTALTRIRELERLLDESRSAMLITRTASIKGCEEGYGKPEKWAEELFRSHGGLTKSIKAIDAALSSKDREKTNG